MQTLPTHPRRLAAKLLRVIGCSLAFTFAAFAGLALADPPMRVARLGYFTGAVSFSPAGESDWVAGTLNRPLVTGDRLWADDRGRVELQIGTAVVRLSARTLFTLTNLDDRIAQMNLQDGTLNLRVRRLDRGQVVEVDTPNLAFVIRQPGEYRVTVDAARNSTEVRTRSGRADVYGKGATYTVGLGRAYRFFGAGLVDYDVLTLPRADEFDRWCQARDQRYDTSISARYVSRDVIGYQDLDQYGSWRNVPEYGYAWTPTRVAANWAPYRDGHWSWVEPWGWTWVDDLPWGFAVSHYGRWINSDGRWAWIPGPVAARAVYAPALVAFIGGSNFQVTASTGNVGAVGWFPLGPREVYRPAYAVSRDYFTNVNITNTVINNTTIINNYDNRNASNVTNVAFVNRSVPGAVVTVPTTAFVQSQPVARAALQVPEAAITAAPVNTLAAVAPTPISVRGAAPQRAMPPQVTEQRFVAQSQPPPAAVGFALRERALAVNPGKPVDAAALAAMKPAAPIAPAATVTPNAPPARATPGAPAAAVAAPRVEIVPEPRTAGQAVVAPPPRAPSDRRGTGESPSPQNLPPAMQAQPAPLPPAAAGARPPTLPAPQEARERGNKPSEPTGRPVVTSPVQAAPVAASPPVPTNRGNNPREQRDTAPVSTVPPMPLRVPPLAQAQPAPMPPAAPAARSPTPPAPQDVRERGNKPSESPPPASAVAPPPPLRSTSPGNPAREQPDTAGVAPPARPQARPPQQNAPAVAEPVQRAPIQPQQVRPETPPAAKPQPSPATPPAAAAVAKPAEPVNNGSPPPKAANGDKKPVIVQEKKGDKKDDNADEDGKPQPDDKERKRK